jgi:hypothetical protein
MAGNDTCTAQGTTQDVVRRISRNPVERQAILGSEQEFEQPELRDFCLVEHVLKSVN